MKTRSSCTSKAVVVLAVLGTASASLAAEVNELKGLALVETRGGVEARVQCTRAPTFNVFRLKDPDRLVVDVSDARLAMLVGQHDGKGPVSGVVASQYSDKDVRVGRLLFALDGARSYDVRAEGTSLIVSIEAAAPATAPVAEAAPAPVAAEPPPAEKAATPTETIVSSRVDERPVARPATRLVALRSSREGLVLETNGEVARFEVIELASPPRVAIDLFDVTGTPRAPKAGGNVRDIRVGPHPGKVRVVAELAEAASFTVRRRPTGLVLALGALKPAVQAVQAASEGPAEAEIDGTPVPVEEAVVDITDLKFHESAQGGEVELRLTGRAVASVERPDLKSAVLTISGARLPRSLERSLDTSALDTPIRMVSAFAVPGSSPAKVRVVVASASPLDQRLSQSAAGLSWTFAPPGGAEQVVQNRDSAGFATEATTLVSEGAPQQRRYVGRRVSFEFKDIDIHNLLRIIAEVSKKNVVVADDVNGKVTLRLRNVPWDQALELVLRSKGLGKEEFGNIIRVAPLSTLQAEAVARAARREAERNARELSVGLIPVNYSTGADMSARVKEVLSNRGAVSVDARTNTLIVRDFEENLARARSLVSTLDLQTPQVLIEARMVEATISFAREVGVQWGGQAAAGPALGNGTGLAFPGYAAVTGGIGNVGNVTGVSTQPNYAVSLPVAAGDGNGGALGITFGSIGNAAALNLRLSALERNGSLKTISAPKVATLDNVGASISQGVDIPFGTVSAAGAAISFVQARLALNVTPHITQDGSVLMTIAAQNNQPDSANPGFGGQPGISRKEAQTTVLVKDGETTVIGGIYVRLGGSNSNSVPFLSKIPVLGFFFKNYRENEQKTELLVFVTPRILNRSTVAQNP